MAWHLQVYANSTRADRVTISRYGSGSNRTRVFTGSGT